MATKIIVSYDGTDNDLDALALGRLLGEAGASIALAYVRHAQEAESGRERLAEHEAKALLETGANVLGQPDIPQHVVLSGSTPEGLRGLALAEHEAGDPCARETAEALASRLGATIAERASSNVDLVVVGSRPGTVTGRVTISAAAEYLIELSSCPVVVVPRGVTVRFDS